MEQIEINKKYEMVSPSLKCRTQAKKIFPLADAFHFIPLCRCGSPETRCLKSLISPDGHIKLFPAPVYKHEDGIAGVYPCHNPGIIVKT